MRYLNLHSLQEETASEPEVLWYEVGLFCRAREIFGDQAGRALCNSN